MNLCSFIQQGTPSAGLKPKHVIFIPDRSAPRLTMTASSFFDLQGSSDQEVWGRYGVKERNVKGQTVVKLNWIKSYSELSEGRGKN